MIMRGLRWIHPFDRCANGRLWMDWKGRSCDLFKGTRHCSRKAEEKTFDRLNDRWRDNIKTVLM